MNKRKFDLAKQESRTDCEREPSSGDRHRGIGPHPLLVLQQKVGNLAVQQMLRGSPIQAKLTISTPGDPEEQEADHVAGQVMRAHAGFPVRPPCSCSESGEACEECSQSSGMIQRRHDSKGDSTGGVTDSLSQAIGAPMVNGESGHALDSATRAFFEPRFGHDFSGVRVHTSQRAADSASRLNALAYTTGKNIVFGASQYDPHSGVGRRLLAHELTHTIQQSAVQPVGHSTVQRAPAPGNSSDALKLDQEYQTALKMEDWPAAAEWLNAFNRSDMLDRLSRLTRRQIAKIHQGALDNPLVGPDSQVAQLTAPNASMSSGAQTNVSSPPPAPTASGAKATSAVAGGTPTGQHLLPPGDCTSVEHQVLQQAVDLACHNTLRCNATDSAATLWQKIGLWAACIAARTLINAKCFRGGNTGHIEALRNAVGALIRCWEIYEFRTAAEAEAKAAAEAEAKAAAEAEAEAAAKAEAEAEAEATAKAEAEAEAEAAAEAETEAATEGIVEYATVAEEGIEAIDVIEIVGAIILL